MNLHFSSDWANSYVKEFPDPRILFEFIESLPSIAALEEPEEEDVSVVPPKVVNTVEEPKRGPLQSAWDMIGQEAVGEAA